MGQQQLLLLVLATVIVGLATVAGIQAFEQGSARANQDALTNTAVKIASDIQAHAKEPTQFGGRGMDEISDGSSSSLTLQELGYETTSGGGDYTSNDHYETSDGECELTTSALGGGDNPVVRCASSDAVVEVTVNGLDSDGIETTQEMQS